LNAAQTYWLFNLNLAAFGGTFFRQDQQDFLIFFIPAGRQVLNILPARLALRARMAGRSILSKERKFRYNQVKWRALLDKINLMGVPG